MLSTLRNLLQNNPLRSMNDEDRQILIVSIVSAFIFWLILNLSRDYQVDKYALVDYQAAPDRTVVGTIQDSIPFRVGGSGWNLIWESFRGRGVALAMDLTDSETAVVSSGEMRQEIERRLSTGDLEVVSLDFDGATVLTTPLDGKRVPVVQGFDDVLRPGFIVAEPPDFTPDSVTVSGAADLIEEFDRWPTARRAPGGTRAFVRTTLDLQEPPPGVSLSQSSVRVEFPVVPYIQRSIDLPVNVINPPPADSFRVFPDLVRVDVSVRQDRYGKLSPQDFRLVADLAERPATEGDNTVALRLLGLPPGVVSARLQPRSVEYYIYQR